MALGKKIETLMLKKGLNIAQLAETSTVEYGALYSLIKRDSKGTNSDNLEKIASALGVSTSELLGTNYDFRDAPPGEATNLEAMKQYFKQKEKLEKFDNQVGRLTTDGKVKVYDYIDDLDPKYKKK